jgi:hypothetical protein
MAELGSTRTDLHRLGLRVPEKPDAEWARHDVAVGDQHIVAVLARDREPPRQVAGHQCVPVDSDKASKIVHIRAHYSDQYAFGAFWSPDSSTESPSA